MATTAEHDRGEVTCGTYDAREPNPSGEELRRIAFAHGAVPSCETCEERRLWPNGSCKVYECIHWAKNPEEHWVPNLRVLADLLACAADIHEQPDDEEAPGGDN